MNQKGNAIILVILLLAVGFIAGYLMAQGMGTSATPPGEHQAVINRMICTDTAFDFNLVPVCVGSVEASWGEHSIVSMDVFEEGRIYQQSTWLWQRHGDTELAMTIWGPGEDGTTIVVEVGRLGHNPFEIKVSGNTVLNWDYTDTNPDVGYFFVEISLQGFS